MVARLPLEIYPCGTNNKNEVKMYLNFGLFDLCVERELLPFSFKMYVTPLKDGYEFLWGKWRLTLSKR